MDATSETSTAHHSGGVYAKGPPNVPTSQPQQAKFVCNDCGQIFDRKFNLDRHKQRKVPCSSRLDATGHTNTTKLLCTVLDVLRGPLNLSEHQAKDEAFVIRILCDLWVSVTMVAKQYPERAFGLVHRLVVEQLNARQVTLLFSVVLVTHYPPNEAMIHTLRALYAQLYHQNEEANQGHAHGLHARQRIASKLQGMWLLEALR